MLDQKPFPRSQGRGSSSLLAGRSTGHPLSSCSLAQGSPRPGCSDSCGTSADQAPPGSSTPRSHPSGRRNSLRSKYPLQTAFSCPDSARSAGRRTTFDSRARDDVPHFIGSCWWQRMAFRSRFGSLKTFTQIPRYPYVRTPKVPNQFC